MSSTLDDIPLTPSSPTNIGCDNNGLVTFKNRETDNQKIADLLIKKATSKINYEGTVSADTYAEIVNVNSKTQRLLRKIIEDAIGRKLEDY